MLWQAAIRSAKDSSKSKQGQRRAGDGAHRRNIHGRYGSGEGPQAPIGAAVPAFRDEKNGAGFCRHRANLTTL
jgi:hypothetical protein